MNDVGAIVVGIGATVVSVGAAVVLVMAILKRRSSDGHVTLSITWKDGNPDENPTRNDDRHDQ